MQLKTFRHLWGVTKPFSKVAPLIKAKGYDGIEYKGRRAAADAGFKPLLKRYGFDFIARIHTVGESLDEHIASFNELIQVSLPLNPVLINSQSGRDSWSMDEKIEFLGRALDFEAQMGIPIAHETHRGRIFYNPWDTRDLLLQFADLKLCCDFSHWVCVCERLLMTESGIIQLCAERCIHLHARVGYEQGPQVPDPRAPEYAGHLQAHATWWRTIWEAQQRRGDAVSTLTPEFGPPHYQHTMPFTNQPISDLEEICNWMAGRQKEEFNQFINTKAHVAHT